LQIFSLEVALIRDQVNFDRRWCMRHKGPYAST